MDKMPQMMRRHVEATIRTHVAQTALGIDMLERMLIAAFLSHPGPWTSVGLSHFVAFPRATVIRRLNSCVRDGFVAKRRGGWCITDGAAELVFQMMLETTEIISGERQGYSRAVVRAYSAFRDVDVSAALTLRWGPLPI